MSKPSKFGQRVRAMRELADMTLQELADACGTTKGHIWEIENKPSIRPSAETAHALAAALDTTIENLLGIADNSDRDKELTSVFMCHFIKLPPHMKELLFKIVKAIEEKP